MLGLWALLTLTGALFSAWLGYGGRAFAATLTAFAFFLLLMLLFAARGMESSLAPRFGAGSGLFLGASEEQKPPGAWEDFLILAGVWLAVKFSPSHWLWPYPGGRLAYVFTVLLCVNVALAAFVLLRRVNGIGYSIGWGRHWGFFILASFLVFACIAIPLGRAMRFIEFAPQWSQWKALPFLLLGILFFTAWPEEFLFRGLLQNMLSRASNSDLAGWWTASILFGFSHITNMGFPNWRYVVLATIAGFFYGWTWRKTGSIFASALVHAAVDSTWHFLFRTV